MRTLVCIALASLLASSGAAASPVDGRCEVADIKTVDALQYALSRRAVDAVNLAARMPSEADPTLTRLMDHTATFSLGTDDVGRPLGVGATGAHALAREMKADTFRFLGWDFIPMRIDTPCASRKVEVEFIDTHEKNIFRVTFTFEAGKIVDASGWRRSYETGPVAPVRD